MIVGMLLILCGIFSGTAMAITCANVTGYAAVTGATVTIGSRTTTTVGTGSYVFNCVALGEYIVKISKPGLTFLPSSKYLAISSSSAPELRVSFRPSLKPTWGVADFWGSYYPSTRAVLLETIAAKACENLVYYDYFCSAPVLSGMLDDEEIQQQKNLGGDFSALYTRARDEVVESHAMAVTRNHDAHPRTTDSNAPTGTGGLESEEGDAEWLEGNEDIDALVKMASSAIEEPRVDNFLAKNHDLNGCSVLDDLPVAGPWFAAGGGILGGVDNLWFGRACTFGHDQCYHHGWDSKWNIPEYGGTEGTKANCDQSFFKDMLATCANMNNLRTLAGGSPLLAVNLFAMCTHFASVYYHGVYFLGSGAYQVDAITTATGKRTSCSPPLSTSSRTGVFGTTFKINAPHNPAYPSCYPAPSNFRLVSVTSNSAMFAWSHTPYPYPSTIQRTRYALKHRGCRETVNNPMSCRSVEDLPAGTTGYTVTGLEPGKDYQFAATATYRTPSDEYLPGGNAVATPYISFTTTPPPAVPCGTSLESSGGSGAYTKVMDLGSTSGVVSIRFETYSIPDALTVRSKNPASTLLYSTGGPVTGTNTGSFSFNPTGLGSRYVDVRVDGNSTPSTQWKLSVSCPR